MPNWFVVPRLSRAKLTVTDEFVELKRDLITATAALSGLASILFGFLTNLPVALAYVSFRLPLFSEC